MDQMDDPAEELDETLTDEAPATEAETRAALLERSNRGFAPLHKSFVQNPDRSVTNRKAPLAQFVRNGDLRGLKALLFLHAIISNGDRGWSATLPLAVWARCLGTTVAAEPSSATTAASKVLSRLEKRNLITRERGPHRQVTVTLLCPDGSGDPYSRPSGGASDRFLKLDNRYWLDGLHNDLDLPATAMLLVALHEKPTFTLATENMPTWYGFSADTAERGFKTLRERGLITWHQKLQKAPLSPTGATLVNVYQLQAPFAAQATATGTNPFPAEGAPQ